jgi:hypothetical protein
MIKMDICLNVKYPYFCPILMKQFSRRILENTRISNFMKIRQVEPSLFRADRHEAKSRFSQFCERV